MTVLLANNVTTTLASAITADASSLVVASNADRFPVITSGQYYYVTLISATGVVEIVKVVSRTGSAMGIVRAQDGTNAVAFAAGSRVELRVNALSILDAVDDGVAEAVADAVATMTVVTDALDLRVDALEAFDTTLGTSAGSNSVGFLQSGISAVARTVQAKLRESMSVFDFMTTAQIADVQARTALVDVTVPLQAAINAACLANVQLFWPSGIYLISASIIAKSNTNWQGEGGNSSIIKNNGTVRFMVNDDDTNMTDVTIDGLGFDYNGYNALNFGTAMSFNGLSHTRFRIVNNRVFDSNYPGNATVNQRQGLFIGNRPEYVWVQGNDFSHGARIKVGRGGKNIFIKNNKLEYINDNAITMAMDGTVASPTGDFTENVHIEDNIILDAIGNGVFVGADGPDILDPTLYIKNLSISRNIIYYNNSETEILQTPRFILLNVPQGNASDINIADNICVMTSNVINTGSGIAGIRITGGGASTTLSRLSISRNRVVCPYKRESAIYFGAAGTINDVTISDNDMDGYSESIWIQTATTINRLTITGNISRNMDRGFRLDSGPVVNSGLYARNRVFSPTAACAFANTASAMTWRVENNEILNSSAYAVEISGAGTKNFVIINNDFRGAALGPVRIFSSAVLSDISARYDNLGDNAIFEITSASTLTLPNARFVSVGGTTNIDNITTTGRAGHVVTLVFGGVLTVNDGTGNLNLAGNFTTTANDTLTLACSGNTWFEVARSVN